MQTLTLRPLSVGEILDLSFAIYRRHFSQLVVIALVTQAAPILIGSFVESAGGRLDHPGLALLDTILSLIAGAIGIAASTQIVSASYLGETMTPWQAFEHALPHVGRLISLSILSGFAIGFGLVLLIVPGIILACGLALGAQVQVLEGTAKASDAMGRSWRLTKGHRGKVAVTLFVAVLLLFVPSIGLGALMGLFEALIGPDSAFLTSLLFNAVFQILLYPYVYSAATVLYYDLRVRKEGFDLEMLEAALKPA